MGITAWKLGSRACLTEPKAESPSTMKISRSFTSLERQSTNFATRPVMSIFAVSLPFKFRRVFSASSRLRLFTSTWPAIFSASRGFSMK